MFSKIVKFFEDVKTEMSKVAWLNRDELVNSTFIVAVISILFTVFIFLADIVISKIVQFFL